MVVIKRSTQSFTVIAPLPGLIKEQPTFCQVHGSSAGTLYWNGRVMRCLECDKVPSYLREAMTRYHNEAFEKKLLKVMKKDEAND